MPKISIPKKPKPDRVGMVKVKQEPAEEIANNHSFSHESNSKITPIKKEFIKTEISPGVQMQKEKIRQNMLKIPMMKGDIIKQEIKTEISPGLQKQLGKKHALKKYDQFALNTSCFWGKYWIKYYPSCAISRNFCYKNNE